MAPKCGGTAWHSFQGYCQARTRMFSGKSGCESRQANIPLKGHTPFTSPGHGFNDNSIKLILVEGTGVEPATPTLRT